MYLKSTPSLGFRLRLEFDKNEKLHGLLHNRETIKGCVTEWYLLKKSYCNFVVLFKKSYCNFEVLIKKS